MSFSAYVHVPYCLRRCGYCDFNTYSNLRLGPGVSGYAAAVGREIGLVARICGSGAGFRGIHEVLARMATHEPGASELIPGINLGEADKSAGQAARMTTHETGAAHQTPGTIPGNLGEPAGQEVTDTAGGSHQIFGGNLPVSATAASPFKADKTTGGASIDTVFFGGGTPTVLPAGDLVRILRDLDAAFGLRPGAEVTTEANPDTVDAEYLSALAAGGFTRVSFGMQSAVSSVLQVLDRTHTQANLEAGVRAAQDLGLEVSVDLIYGTPGETLADWRESVEAALALGVSHVSCYALTIEPATALGRALVQGRIAPVDGDDQAEKYELADSLLSAAGLEWYEISNWARPGHECRHNLAYWRNRDYYGFGPGAHSHLGARIWAGAQVPEGGGVAGGGRPQEVDFSGAEGQIRGGDQRCEDNSRAGAQVLEGGGVAGGGRVRAGSCDREESLRFWNLKHPVAWDKVVSAGRLPIADSETVTGESAQLEDLLLGLRLREGLDLREYARKYAPAPHDINPVSNRETASGNPNSEKATTRGESEGCRLAPHEFETKLLAEAQQLATEGLLETGPLQSGARETGALAEPVGEPGIRLPRETVVAEFPAGSETPRAVLTRRGRLLADTVIQRLAAL